jgi:hypothetical protein
VMELKCRRLLHKKKREWCKARISITDNLL